LDLRSFSGELSGKNMKIHVVISREAKTLLKLDMKIP
jgi:hypothetical protein